MKLAKKISVKSVYCRMSTFWTRERHDRRWIW